MPLLSMSLEVTDVLFPGLFSTGWDTDVTAGSRVATLNPNGICVLSVDVRALLYRLLSLDSCIRENMLKSCFICYIWGLFVTDI